MAIFTNALKEQILQDLLNHGHVEFSNYGEYKYFSDISIEYSVTNRSLKVYKQFICIINKSGNVSIDEAMRYILLICNSSNLLTI